MKSGPGSLAQSQSLRQKHHDGKMLQVQVNFHIYLKMLKEYHHAL